MVPGATQNCPQCTNILVLDGRVQLRREFRMHFDWLLIFTLSQTRIFLQKNTRILNCDLHSRNKILLKIDQNQIPIQFPDFSLTLFIISRRCRRPGDGRYCNSPRPSICLSVTFSFQKRIAVFSRNFAGTCTKSWGCSV